MEVFTNKFSRVQRIPGKPGGVPGVMAALVFMGLLFTGCVSNALSGSSTGDSNEAPVQVIIPSVNIPPDPSRVIISSDIGGTDDDDFQSMVHLFLYADRLDIEGLIASPHGNGRVKDIHAVIDCYEQDYASLITYSPDYPTAAELRAVTKQGALDYAGPEGISQESSEGSDWIIRCARRDDPRPLHILVWGGIEDLAQALHDAPDILPKLRVYFIGGPNKKWSPGAYNYIAVNHPDLWIIESNSTYRGWFTGGNQTGEWNSSLFVYQHIRGHGKLGEFFDSKMNTIKMGDTPSVMRILYGVPEDPAQPSWGGQYVRAWTRPYVRFDNFSTCADSIEIFGILELNIPLESETGDVVNAKMIVENQSLPGLYTGSAVKFLFSPKDPKEYQYTIESDVESLNGKTGCITSYLPPADIRLNPDPAFSHWWTDDPSPELAEGVSRGAKTISKWREEFLYDFKIRMDRCLSPKE